MSELPAGVIPVHTRTTREILHGSRDTTHRYELLEHDPSTGLDSLVGYLDGVKPGGRLTWVAGATVKKSGELTVTDLATAAPGMKRLADVSIVTARIRVVQIADGLPEMPRGVYVVTASPEQWEGTGREFELELHDKTTVLDEDEIDATFTAGTDAPVLSIVKSVIEAAGETITVDGSDVRTLAQPIVFPVGTSRIAIVNTLLDAIAYQSLWMDGTGAFRATPYVRPADRSIRYATLTDENGARLVRELVDGEESIYLPDWIRDRNVHGIPNKVVTIAPERGDAEPLSGVATNENPDSDFSYQKRGRWKTVTLRNIETPDYGRSAAGSLPGLAEELEQFRATTSGGSGWSDRSHTLADEATAAATSLSATMSDIAEVAAFAAAAATFHAAAYAGSPVEATVDAAAEALEDAALAAAPLAEARAIADQIAFLDDKAYEALIAMSAVQATVSVQILPIPLELLDALIFGSTPAEINDRHTVQSAVIELASDGLMSLELMEVIDL